MVQKSKKMIRLWALACLLSGAIAHGQSSLAPRVLVVYATNDANSVAVANHYQSARGVPAGNLCPVTLPDATAYGLTMADYVTYVKTPVRSCLSSVGQQNILYILLAYIRPIGVYAPSTFGYALDSYLADIWDQYATQYANPPLAAQRYYAESQSQGNVFVPFQSLADFRASARAPLIYSVWRLDGATPAVAQAEVDNVLQAEAAGGPPLSQLRGTAGNACIDLLSWPVGLADSGYTSGNWDLYRAWQFLTSANNLNVVLDAQATSFGVSPSPNCLNTSAYVGWYNYGNYNNAFSWNPGSIGWDLDSGALTDPRAGSWWGTGALAAGVSVTAGAFAEPYLAGIPRPAVIRNLLEGANVGDAFLRNTRWLKWRIVNVGDPLYRPFPGGVAPFNMPATLPSLSFYQGQAFFRQFVGGTQIAAQVSLAAPAPTNGLTVTVTADNSAVNPTSSVTVPAGQTSATFYVTTLPVTTGTDIQVTAAAGSFSATNTVSLYPLLVGPYFPSNPVQNGIASQAQGGATVQAVMTLNASAPLGGAAVQISSDQPSLASVPPTVTVPAGLSQVAFTVSTAPVTAQSAVTLTSSYAGAANKVSLVLTP